MCCGGNSSYGYFVCWPLWNSPANRLYSNMFKKPSGQKAAQQYSFWSLQTMKGMIH